ncbi:unnamed protein product [Microthlaspi erraticum]|uniref:Uncharacterized protein n=1 Tax=Microthlaspi erraticum TaxID=1685480 RepID=A0A6D2L4J8_9BRAS|nr:unnamed protein product [Microthlaspi erraticum]CAA7056261.1 unnamed protein product [Microthlaspi erraticum]
MMDPCEVERLEHTRLVPHTYVEKTAIYIYGNADDHTIGRHMRQLKHLELRFSPMNDKGLSFLCKTCSNLEYLDLFGCKYLTSVGVTNSISRLTSQEFEGYQESKIYKFVII